MVKPDAALPGRSVALPTAAHHFVNGHALKGPFPDGFSQVQLGMGCFWGAERLFWELPGVWVTAVGYSGGFTPNPTYEEVCSGRTGHAETVLVVFDPNAISLERVLKAFWEGHDPTQGMRQGNDRGTQYRSCVFVDGDTELATVRSSLNAYQEKLRAGGYGEITTEIGAAPEFYYAEDYHQQYLAKNPRGYCGLGGTGVTCPVGVNA
ncbi:peptide-methionine (S)-S-oxide reductase MsrA [Amaricoccus macauensis]|uniref:peptide-methionine (S)-S-oxide reductase MsrA n=1 Tax=Amaricoccus macauensis TaxID=57001 RepID=UPI003C7DC65A